MTNVRVFVDAENISFKKFKPSFTIIKKRFPEARIIAFGNYSRISNNYKENDRIEFVNTAIGKNSADTIMLTSILSCLYEEDAIKFFIIISADRDFTCAIKKITDKGKHVILTNSEQHIRQSLSDYKVNPEFVRDLESKPIISNKRIVFWLKDRHDMYHCYNIVEGTTVAQFAKTIDATRFFGYGTAYTGGFIGSVKKLLKNSYMHVSSNRGIISYMDEEKLMELAIKEGEGYNGEEEI
jgi:hypothetical protein